MENPNITDRFPLFLQQESIVKQFAVSEALSLIGETHEICGANYRYQKVDAYFDLKPNERDSHKAVLSLQGIPALECECLDGEMDNNPSGLVELMPGTAHLIGFLFSRENPELSIEGKPTLIKLKK